MTDENTYEKELLLRIANGDEKAFRELVSSYAGLLHNFIARHTESESLAEEIVQDVFLQLWLTRETLQDIRNFRTYLYVISRNQTINAVKKLVREQIRQRDWAVTNAHTWNEEPDERISLIEEAIAQLPAQKKKAWILSKREGKTYQEIAAEMNISRETVKTHLQIANEQILKYVTDRMDLLLLITFFKKMF